VRPINVRTNPPAAGDRTTRPRWDSNACVEVTVAADLTDVYGVALGVGSTAVFIAGVAYLVGNALVTDPVWTSVTFAIVLAGVPVYSVFFATKNTKT